MATSKSNQEKAVELLKSIQTGDSAPVGYINPDKYIQHNPAMADGLDGLGAALKSMAENDVIMRYDKIHKVLGEGNFVLVVSEGAFGKGEGVPTSFYDLFRVENRKIAEHWDVMETIAPKNTWKNNSGKFNF